MLLKVQDISFVEYYTLRDKSLYNYYLEYAKLPVLDLFKIGDIMDQSFGFVKDMQDYLNHTGLTWEIFIDEISKLKDISKKQVVKNSLFRMQSARIWLREQIIMINDIESGALGYNASAEEQAAGIEVFSKYRAFLQFDNLSGGDVTKIAAVRALPYSTCFAKLKLDADRNEYDQKLREILKRKK